MNSAKRTKFFGNYDFGIWNVTLDQQVNVAQN